MVCRWVCLCAYIHEIFKWVWISGKLVLACNAESMLRQMRSVLYILLKMPGLENSPLKANIVIHIFYKSLVYCVKQKQF
jgi:hypothetical protein